MRTAVFTFSTMDYIDARLHAAGSSVQQSLYDTSFVHDQSQFELLGGDHARLSGLWRLAALVIVQNVSDEARKRFEG
jgi:hypothetical protein